MNLDSGTSGVRDTAGSYALAEAGGEAVSVGYKRSEVGVIPEEWSQTTIRGIASPVKNAIVGGPFGSDLVSNDYVENGVPVIRGQNMGSPWISGNFAFVSPSKARSLQSNLARPADLVFTQRGTLGQVSVVPEGQYDRYLISQSQMKLTVNGSIADSKFFYYLFTGKYHQALIERETIQTGVPHINLGILRNFSVQVPPLSEQRVIAAALSDVDALLAKLDQLIAKKRDLKQAAMQQLLAGDIRLPGFSAPWRDTFAGDVGTFRGGNGFPTREQGSMAGVYPYFKVSDMNHAGNEVRMITSNNWISEEARKRIGATVFPADSIVFAKVGAAVFLERKKILTMPSCIDNNMAAFVVDAEQVVSGFMHYVFLNLKFGALVSTTALPSLGGRELAQIEIRLPPRSEQTAIATILSDMDAELAALETRRAKTCELKQGMMQALLTGRIRLV